LLFIPNSYPIVNVIYYMILYLFGIYINKFHFNSESVIFNSFALPVYHLIICIWYFDIRGALIILFGAGVTFYFLVASKVNYYTKWKFYSLILMIILSTYVGVFEDRSVIKYDIDVSQSNVDIDVITSTVDKYDTSKTVSTSTTENATTGKSNSSADTSNSTSNESKVDTSKLADATTKSAVDTSKPAVATTKSAVDTSNPSIKPSFLSKVINIFWTIYEWVVWFFKSIFGWILWVPKTIFRVTLYLISSVMNFISHMFNAISEAIVNNIYNPSPEFRFLYLVSSTFGLTYFWIKVIQPN